MAEDAGILHFLVTPRDHAVDRVPQTFERRGKISIFWMSRGS